MNIDLFWDDDQQTILLCEVRKGWTWDDLMRTMRTIKKITDAADYEIAAIVDLHDGMSVPGGSPFSGTALENAKQILNMGKDGTGPIVIVGAGGVVRSAYNFFLSINPKALSNIHFADTQEQARQFISGRPASV